MTPSPRHPEFTDAYIASRARYNAIADAVIAEMPNAGVVVTDEGFAGWAIWIDTGAARNAHFVATDWDGPWLVGHYTDATRETPVADGYHDVVPETHARTAAPDAIAHAIADHVRDVVRNYRG